MATALPLSASQAGMTPTDNDSTQWQLVWSDEFSTDGAPDSSSWSYEQGYVRNHENQWYQADNARCKDGCLIIEARSEHGRAGISCTSSSVNTRGKRAFLYGHVEVRAKIPTGPGAWPAIWMLGEEMEWPSCGEIDIMEYYRINGVPHILANACWGSDRPLEAVWNSRRVPYSHFTDRDAAWAEKFHIWRMDWDEDAIKIYLDGELINALDLTTTVNGSLGHGSNPFHHPQYILLNLALGGDHGGEFTDKDLPQRYFIDYVRVYQQKKQTH